MITKIKKRDGRIVRFRKEKIVEAIWKGMQAVNVGNKDLAEKLADEVLELLVNRLKPGETASVEQVQDLVEEVLVKNGQYRVVKEYILYRALHAQIRELVDEYLLKKTWLVKENANTTYSLQALNFHVSSQVISRYWLHKIYKSAPEVRRAHLNGDFHIHNLAILGPYCVGWDLPDLLLSGFKGVKGKIESKPAKHFRVALGQIVNFFFTLQGESAGAQAFSSFDSYLAPFIRYDNLSYESVKQALQEFIFNMNVPTRVGFQCLSEDTEILTPYGWKTYRELKEGSVIFTFNLKTCQLEKRRVESVFVKKYKGVMYNLRGEAQNQLISPGHRVVIFLPNKGKFELKPIEEILKFGSPVLVPTIAENNNLDFNVSTDELMFFSSIISQGIVGEGNEEVFIQAAESGKCFNYGEGGKYILKPPFSKNSLSDFSNFFRELLAERSNKFFFLLSNLSKEQARLILDHIKGKNLGEGNKKVLIVTDRKILETLEFLAVLAGFSFNVEKIKCEEGGCRPLHVLTLKKDPYEPIHSIKKTYYEGVIWSVHTSNETVIAKREGQVFITGNTPFTNVTLDLEVPSFMKDQLVIVGGKIKGEAYGDFQKEVDIFNRALAEVMLEGDAAKRVFTFPIPTINITKDFEWESETVKTVFQTSAKYGIPYFANFICSEMKPEDVRSMCCHLRLDRRELRKRGGLFNSYPLTGSIGVVTLNMPRIGYLLRDEDDFFEKVAELMKTAKVALEIKREWLEKFTEEGLYPYSKFYLRNIKEMLGSYWSNHFSTIGLVGMNECCLNFLSCDMTDKEGVKFAEKTLDFMKNMVQKFQTETGNLYNLEATPAEGASYRLAKIDKTKYPNIKAANNEAVERGAEPYYTNSTQLPVYFKGGLWKALKLQEKLQTKYTGGTVFHVWLGESSPPVESVINLVKKICENFQIPYFTLTPTFSICPFHGYIKGEHLTCPECKLEGRKTKCEVYSRVVGYLRPIDQWNPGKQEEFKQRKTFDEAMATLK